LGPACARSHWDAARRWQPLLLRLESKWDALSVRAGLRCVAGCLKRLAAAQARGALQPALHACRCPRTRRSCAPVRPRARAHRPRWSRPAAARACSSTPSPWQAGAFSRQCCATWPRRAARRACATSAALSSTPRPRSRCARPGAPLALRLAGGGAAHDLPGIHEAQLKALQSSWIRQRQDVLCTWLAQPPAGSMLAWSSTRPAPLPAPRSHPAGAPTARRRGPRCPRAPWLRRPLQCCTAPRAARATAPRPSASCTPSSRRVAQASLPYPSSRRPPACLIRFKH